MDTLEIRDLLDKDVYDEVLSRVEKLTPESQPKWGEMAVGQMLAHTSEVLEVYNGKGLLGTPWFVKLFKGYVKRMVLNDKPYKQGIHTHPQYKVTSLKKFDKEKHRLLDALSSFFNDEDIANKKHPLFGMMTKLEKGWAMYKHIDHHLTQFGV